MDADQIEHMLLNDVRAARGHDVFTASSALDLVGLIQDGAKTMVVEGRTRENDLREAQDNLHRFLNEIEIVRIDLGYAEFREDTISMARGSLVHCGLFADG